MNRLKLIAAIVLVCSVGACAGDQGIRITAQNKDSVLEEIKASRAFTPEEVGLLAARQARVNIATVMKVEPPTWVGLTLKEAIAEERRFVAEAKAKENESERLATEAKAKQEAMAAELRKAISLTVFDKTFKPKNIYASEFEDYIVFKCVYENVSGKDIRAFRGAVRFSDLFDKEIAIITLTIDDPIGSGKKADWTGSIKYNQFNDSHNALRNADLVNMKITWIPASIIFADGTQIGEK